MLFKNLNNFTLEERVLYLQDKTKEIAEWITVHGAESKDIHARIEEQIQRVISDTNTAVANALQEAKDYADSSSAAAGGYMHYIKFEKPGVVYNTFYIMLFLHTNTPIQNIQDLVDLMPTNVSFLASGKIYLGNQDSGNGNVYCASFVNGGIRFNYTHGTNQESSIVVKQDSGYTVTDTVK